jgi:type VI secretion system protein ImpJ
MQVHWHEGLFLLPHHLQRLQQGANESLIAERDRTWAYSYGVIDARLSQDDLENMRLRFDRLHAILPNGQEVRFPQDAELPAIDIKQAFESRGSFKVYLAVPLWFSARANSVNPGETVDARAKILYRVVETEVADENTGENVKPVLQRRISARLLLEGEDASDLDTMPLLRVSRAAGEEAGLPRRDPEFVGPCLIVNGSAALRELIRDLTNQVLGSRSELVIQVNRGGFSIDTMRGIQFEQVMRLRTLNRYGARLESLIETNNLAPFTVYLELRELLGELAALHPDRDMFECLPYDHDNPYPCFAELAGKLRQTLKGAVAPSFLKAPFVFADDSYRTALTDEHFLRPSDYFLGIKTKDDPRSLAAYVEDADKFKLMPPSLAGRAIRGVLVKEERFPPLELPAESNLYYFRLLRGDSARTWQQIQNEKGAVIRYTGRERPDYEITLYMTLPRGES